MRRRRTAASEDVASSPALDPAETPVVNTQLPPQEAAAEPKPSRRRGSRKTVAEPTADAVVIEEVPLATAPEAEPVPSPRRRGRRTKAEDETPSADEPSALGPVTPTNGRRRGRGKVGNVSAESTENATSVPSSAVPESAESTLGQGQAEEKRPRRSRRTAAAQGESDAGLVVDSATTGESAGAEAAEKPKRARRGRKPSGSEAEENGLQAPDAPAEVTPVEGRSRTRGLRRTRTVAAPQLMVSGPDEVQVAEDVDSAATETGSGTGRRRSRGTRRPVAAPTEPPPPPEPVRPAYVPLPQEVLNRLPDAKLRREGQRVVLRVDDEPVLPAAFFVNTEIHADDLSVAEREIRLAYQRGMRLFSFLAHLPWPGKDGTRRTESLDKALEFLAANAPEARLIPRMIFSAPPAWLRRHPDEVAVHDQGTTEDVSLGSRLFWEDEADQAVRAAVEHVAQGPHAHRVVGFYLERGEWFHDRDGGYDRCKANQAGFRRWLRQRYRNSVVALQSAWHDGGVTFDNADVPGWPPPQGYPAGMGQFFGPRERRWVDYHEYASEMVANVIVGLGRAVKEASGGRSLVAVSYGYTLELPRAHSGHLALARVLDSPDIDILTGPVSYSGRAPGGSAPAPAPWDSIALAGKLWISEDDTKTHLASDETSDPFNERVPDVDGTRAVHLRNFGAALAKGTGISWMDLWGEGWLDDRETWEFLGDLRSIMETYTGSPDRAHAVTGPDVAVIVDERSFFSVRNDDLLATLVADQRDALARCGARIGFFLQSDLVKPEFPESVRLLLFLNPFHIEPAVRSVIKDRYQDNGRTLAWIFAPGILDGPVSEVSEVVGMQLKLQPWGSRVGTSIRAGIRSRLTERLPELKFGQDCRRDPSLCVVDPRAEILGDYPGGGAAMAVRKHPRWQSVFFGDPGLTVSLLRGLFRLAGVPIYTQDDDVCWLGDGMACLHSDPGGGTRMFLPAPAALHDLVYDETLASGGRGARFSIPRQATRLLVFGPAESLRRDYGVDPEVAPPGLEDAEVPEIAAFHYEEAAAPVRSSAKESESRLFAQAIATMSLPSAEDKSETEPENGAPAAQSRSSRRRRRRRGKGGEAAELPDDVSDTLPGDVEEGVATEKARPTLEELLPAAVDIAGADLPPVPEEFLPIDDASIGEGRPARRRRRRGRGGRGGIGTEADRGSADTAPETPPTELGDGGE